MIDVVRPIAERFRGLRMKAAVVLCGVVLAATVVTAALYVRLATRLVKDQAQSRVNELAQAVAVSATSAIVRNDHERLLAVATDLISSGDQIRYVAFADPAGRVLAGAQKGVGQLTSVLAEGGSTMPIDALRQPSSVVDSTGQPRLDVTAPIFLHSGGPAGATPDSTVGFVRLGLSLEAVNERTARVSEQVIGVAALIAALMIPLGFGLVNRLIVPLQRLGEAARALASGRLDQRVSLNRNDEIGELATAFNAMAEDLAHSHRDMMRHKEELEDHVLARTYQLTELNRRLQEEVAEKDDFLRAVSHDLSAPLRNVTGMTMLLRDRWAGQIDGDAGDLLKRIDGSVRHELELIDELLELSRIRTRRGEIQRVDLHEVVTAAADQFAFEMRSRGIEFEIEGRLPIVFADRTRMRQLFQNLIDNAVKYTDPAAPAPTRRVRITCVDRPDVYEFRVADNGIGIAPRDRDRIFYVFRRAKDGFVAKTAGKGVGLATCKGIVQNYGGRIWVEPNSGGGSVFCLELLKSRLARPVNLNLRPMAEPAATPASDASDARIGAGA